ncbi:MAG: hypothetical protein DBY43_01800 [Clostridiaceae bacterium]|nr:MAG: hypothetical protein DBY43_01800 [Clostridiaceae bacterium]
MEDKKKIKIYYGLLITLVVFMGVSYAWFRLKLTQTNSNVIGTRTCLDASLTEKTSKITLSDAFPISDEDGLKQTPFTFTLKNNCDSYVKVYITIDSTYRESTDAAYLKDSFLKVNLSSKGTTDGSSVLLGSQNLTELEGTNKGYILVTTGLKANEEKSYDLRVWMDGETSIADGLNKNWEGKIVVVGVAANEPATLRETILANNEVKTPLTAPGKEVSAHVLEDVDSQTSSADFSQKYYVTYGTGWEANGTKFNLTGTAVTSDTYANSYSSLVGKYLTSSWLGNAGSSTAGTMVTTTNLKSVYYVLSATSSSFTYKPISSNKNTTEALLASAEDDYGTSYYFRGAVTNNYVEFANKCWRIVRITGDGSVKLVLHNDNTSGSSSPCASSNNSTSTAFARYSGSSYTSAFNSNYDDNAYIGFMYGATGASDYASTHANTNKSTILTNLETWYTNNLASYESKLADTIWCNDKSTVSGGLGYGTNDTNYGVYNRLVSTKQPTLKCPNDNNGGKLSKFTVNDTTNGNGNLTYKIGLLTADEIAFAGYANGSSNTTTYLHENATSDYWWSLSPGYFNGDYTSVWRVGSGNLHIDGIEVNVSSNFGLRPAISLVSSTTVTGDGTSENPYIIN